jgi:magnesium transporter
MAAPNPKKPLAMADSVGLHAVHDIPIGRLGEPVGAILKRLGERRFAMIDPVFVCDAERHPVGLSHLTDLLTADLSRPVDDLLHRDVPVALESLDQEHAAALARRHHLTALPVVDSEGRLLGCIPSAALIDISRHEHAEDISRLAGIVHQIDHAHIAAEASPWRRLRDRLPWLIVGLLGSMIATTVMARFEHLLARQLAVALFIPAIVYLADAIGTQTEAVAVRALSLPHGPLARMLAGEVATGALIGATLGAIAWAMIYWTFGDIRLASSVGGAIIIAGSIATTCGFLLPWLLSRFGADPAFGSGPVATVIQDVLSLLIYFVIAGALFGL